MAPFELIIFRIQRCTDILQIWIISMLNEKHTCPVCGFAELDEPAYDAYGCASFNICPSCGTEFGYDDSTTAHKQLRHRWIEDGMHWASRAMTPPIGWDPVKQLKSARMFD